jgi:hypothetical protein
MSERMTVNPVGLSASRNELERKLQKRKSLDRSAFSEAIQGV